MESEPWYIAFTFYARTFSRAVAHQQFLDELVSMRRCFMIHKSTIYNTQGSASADNTRWKRNAAHAGLPILLARLVCIVNSTLSFLLGPAVAVAAVPLTPSPNPGCVAAPAKTSRASPGMRS